MELKGDDNMTVGKLKELLNQYPDDARVWSRYKDAEIIQVDGVAYDIEKKQDGITLYSRDFINMEKYLKELVDNAEEKYGDNEVDFFIDLYELGIIPDDFKAFKYETWRYEWAKENFENYGLTNDNPVW